MRLEFPEDSQAGIRMATEEQLLSYNGEAEAYRGIDFAYVHLNAGEARQLNLVSGDGFQNSWSYKVTNAAPVVVKENGVLVPVSSQLVSRNYQVLPGDFENGAGAATYPFASVANYTIERIRQEIRTRRIFIIRVPNGNLEYAYYALNMTGNKLEGILRIESNGYPIFSQPRSMRLRDNWMPGGVGVFYTNSYDWAKNLTGITHHVFYMESLPDLANSSSHAEIYRRARAETDAMRLPRPAQITFLWSGNWSNMPDDYHKAIVTLTVYRFGKKDSQAFIMNIEGKSDTYLMQGATWGFPAIGSTVSTKFTDAKRLASASAVMSVSYGRFGSDSFSDFAEPALVAKEPRLPLPSEK
jgi:hypothetical protein